MRKLSPIAAEEIMQRDVKNVMNFAKYIIVLDSEMRFNVIQNSRHRLGVIAIVGPATKMTQIGEEEISFSNIKIPSAVLLEEIGIGASRPYNEAQGCNNNGDESKIVRRRNWFCLSVDQYKAIAKKVFELIQVRTDEKVQLWIGEPVFRTKITRNYYHRSSRSHSNTQRKVEYPKGLRYSVPRRGYFFSDVACAEIYSNSQVEEELSGLSRYIDLMLNNKYRKNTHSGEKFFRLKYVRDIIENLRDEKKISCVRLQRVLEMNLIKDSRFRDQIAPLLGVNSGSVEEYLGEYFLPDYNKRINDMQLRIINYSADYVVFEVFPLKPLQT